MPIGLAPSDEVHNNQKVTGKPHLVNDVEFKLEAISDKLERRRRSIRLAAYPNPRSIDFRGAAQCSPLRRWEVRQVSFAQLDFSRTSRRNMKRVFNRLEYLQIRQPSLQANEGTAAQRNDAGGEGR